VEIDGKTCHSPKRKYCYECNPIGERNFWGNKKTRIKKAKEDGSFDPNKRLSFLRTFTCKECNRTFTQKTSSNVCSACKGKRYRHNKKRKAIDFLGGKCEKCGYNKCKEALDFHHKDPNEKKFNISPNWGRPWKILEPELKKCSLLCCRCHVETHYL